MFGSLGGILPLRLGGTDKNGWSAAQHARLVADLVAVKRTAPLASWTFNEATATLSNYRGWNGAGPAHAPTVSEAGTGTVTFNWSDRVMVDPVDPTIMRPLRVKFAAVRPRNSGLFTTYTTTASGITVEAYDEFGPNVIGAYDVKLYGFVGDSDRVEISDYAGDLNKRDNTTESKAPYAARVLSELRRARGTAYSVRPSTLVHVENVALARLISWGGYRLPEKVRANALPGTSDEKLDYWIEVLRLAKSNDDRPAQMRERAAAHYRAVTGNALDDVIAAVEAILGEAYLTYGILTGASLSSPPADTYWDAGTPGDPDFDLGGGTWQSSRSHLGIGASRPTWMPESEFNSLISETHRLLDRMLPAWMTFEIIT